MLVFLISPQLTHSLIFYLEGKTKPTPSPPSTRFPHGSRGQNKCHLSMPVLGNISTAFLGLSVDGNISITTLHH